MTDFLRLKLVVTGASGNLGRRIVELLAAKGANNLIAATREPDKLDGFSGIDVRRADFSEPASLDAAFAGADRVLMISTDRIDVPGLRIQQHKAAVAAAKRAGVKRILYTSMLNPDRSFIPFAPDHLETERAIEQSGIEFTILRVSWYAEGLLDTLAAPLKTGKWYSAAGAGRISYVPREDVARAAAAALLSPSGANERPNITGAELLTVPDIAKIASDVTGKPIEVAPVSDEALEKGLVAAGLPPFVIPLVVGTDRNIRAGNFDVASDAVQRLTGEPPQSVRDFLAANRAVLPA
jgi:NAD(P)H dehydrogenase (quinone)